MKFDPTTVRVDMPKGITVAGGLLKVEPAARPGKANPKFIEEPAELDIADDLPVKPQKSPPASGRVPLHSAASASPGLLRDDYSATREAALSVERIKAAAQQELEQIRRMRADAIRYQQETATKARSEANQLILRARLATQREIEDLIRQASEEIQKMLADIRVIRITAQEELSAQRKFTDAAKLNSLSLSFKEQLEKTMSEKTGCDKAASRPKRQPIPTR